MKEKLIFAVFCAGVLLMDANAAVRDASSTTRTTGASATTTQKSNSVARAPTNTTQNSRNIGIRDTRTTQSARTATTRATTARTATSSVRAPDNTSRRSATSRAVARGASVARATTESATTETKTGAAYEQCKTAYFTCMDQFCQLKNDDYRRCSCNDRVYDLTTARETIRSAGEKLTTFTENLDVVGMSAAQATAMKTASDGENALTSDKSASKALLQAIMNSIRGTDSSVSGKFSDLNSINMSFDTANAFGDADNGQLIATYNGQTLYSAVYPKCRQAVKADCNDAALQRAITAYLMAIEQDCNTVQTAIDAKQKETKSAIREGSAMLDLARVENRQKHNSSDITTCVNEVESAVLSEEVCGTDYHKCLDNGEYIEITTGKPIAGVEDFYKLGQLLTFSSGVDATNQKLSKISNNRTFVQNFEARVKKFAEPALDKCVENADDAWSEYLDRALLAIYYAQQAKVKEIQQGCFDFISTCYSNVDTGLTDAMKALINDSSLVLQPDKITLNKQMCNDYVQSCNNMFGNNGEENLIESYVNTRQDTDTVTACRAVAQQCFDSFGGTGYENFYYPYSGLFSTGAALDWFTLYGPDNTIVSECAKQLYNIESCKDNIETVFGGFDKKYIATTTSDANGNYTISNDDTNGSRYGTIANGTTLNHHVARPTGIATEVYNQIVDILTTSCMNLQGRFLELQYINIGYAHYDTDNLCLINDTHSDYSDMITPYGIGTNEDMCPRDYNRQVDTQSWGACLCWENGGRRSKWGKSPKCMAILPTSTATNDTKCWNAPFAWINTISAHGYPTLIYTSNETPASGDSVYQHSTDTGAYSTVYQYISSQTPPLIKISAGQTLYTRNSGQDAHVTLGIASTDTTKWCTVTGFSETNQVCSISNNGYLISSEGNCVSDTTTNTPFDKLPEGI